MRISFFIILVLFYLNTFCQNETSSLSRKGFVVGLGVGAGSLSMSVKDSISFNSTEFSTTIPNIKIGYMLNNRLALLMLLPGANYKYKSKDRGFEGLVVSCQYWIKEKWWILAGAGLTFDAPAFYTVKDPKTAGFYTGFPSISVGNGLEIWRKRRFAMDLQYRAFYGKSNLLNGGYRQGFSNMFILGFNWY